MAEAPRMSSNRPYLLRALYEWIADNGMTPHLLVDATRPDVRVPMSAVKDGRIKKGELVLFEAMGGGFTWGAVLARY